MRSGTGVNEVAADAEICALELEDHELLPVIAPSWEVVLGGWYVNRYREFRSRGRYRRCMERRSRPVQMLDEGDDSTLVAEVVVLSVSLVHHDDPDAGVQERELTQSLRENIE